MTAENVRPESADDRLAWMLPHVLERGVRVAGELDPLYRVAAVPFRGAPLSSIHAAQSPAFPRS
jgi:hypothetical protein